MSNFVGLIILDGYGLRKNRKGNAIKIANPKNINNYFKYYPFTKLNASGESVGLPAGQIGNSEVGHLNIGAGVVVMQSLLKINNAIKDGEFFKNKALLKSINHVKSNNSTLHIIGLTSSGGVHSHINHLYALIDMAVKNNVKNVVVHAITDGRDTLREQAKLEVVQLEKYINKNTNYKLATVSGRFYAMDREKNWERIKTAYDTIVYGKANKTFESVEFGLNESYENNVYDEFLKPFVVKNNEDKAYSGINDNDAIIFYNFREDRARQLAQCFTNKNFEHFAVKQINNLAVSTFTRYDEKDLLPEVAFEKNYLTENLSSVVSLNNLKQFKITETTKYAHVTYFLNGGIEKPYENEDRFLIETIKTEKFDEYPEMRAAEITDKAIELISQSNYNLMVLNYSNCDMIGHTGNLNAAIETVKIVDEQVKRLVDAILGVGGTAILCADHGNAEEMIDKKGRVLTDHTTNKVPFCIVSNKHNNVRLTSGGSLSNIAPTILDLLGVKSPKNFEASLIK